LQYPTLDTIFHNITFHEKGASAGDVGGRDGHMTDQGPDTRGGGDGH